MTKTLRLWSMNKRGDSRRVVDCASFTALWLALTTPEVQECLKGFTQLEVISGRPTLLGGDGYVFRYPCCWLDGQMRRGDYRRSVLNLVQNKSDQRQAQRRLKDVLEKKRRALAHRSRPRADRPRKTKWNSPRYFGS